MPWGRGSFSSPNFLNTPLFFPPIHFEHYQLLRHEAWGIVGMVISDLICSTVRADFKKRWRFEGTSAHFWVHTFIFWCRLEHFTHFKLEVHDFNFSLWGKRRKEKRKEKKENCLLACRPRVRVEELWELDTAKEKETLLTEEVTKVKRESDRNSGKKQTREHRCCVRVCVMCFNKWPNLPIYWYNQVFYLPFHSTETVARLLALAINANDFFVTVTLQGN